MPGLTDFVMQAKPLSDSVVEDYVQKMDPSEETRKPMGDFERLTQRSKKMENVK